MEAWRAVVGYEGRYEVSVLGRIRSLYHDRDLTQYKLSPSARYLVVRLTDANGVGRAKPVHHLVLEAFVGARPEGLIGLHGQAGAEDNSLSNLSWGSYEQNNGSDRVRDGTASVGSKHGNAKLIEDQVVDIRRQYAQGNVSHRDLANAYRVSTTVILNIIKRRTWKHV